jgi:UDP-N-acetyl-D-mannosaminuronate dehydrogenase
VVVILTDHDAFDYEQIATHASCVVDTRNAIGERVQINLSNVRTLGNGSFQTGPSMIANAPSS